MSAKASIHRVERLAAHLGAKINVGYGRYYRLEAEAPDGKVWASDGLHVLVEETSDSRASWREQANVDLLERMNYGLQDCKDPECDSCHPEEEEG